LRHIAVSVGFFLAAIALLIPVRFDSRLRTNIAEAEQGTCWVKEDERCCERVDSIWVNCIEDAIDKPVDPEG
jgi:hypothetical protein